MVMQDLNLMSALLQKMDWTENRQKLFAANIANADTPDYKPQDLDPLDFKGLLEGSTSKISLAAAGASGGTTQGLSTTDPMHIPLNSAAAGEGRRQKHSYEVSPSGNAVVIEEQLIKMNANYADHNLASNLYLRNMAMLKTSLKSQ